MARYPKLWMDFDQRLRKQQTSYWLSDVSGGPVTFYDYKHDRGIFESPWRVVTITKDHPLPVARVFTLKCGTSGVIVHLVYSGGREVSIPLDGAKLEHHPDFDVLYVE